MIKEYLKIWRILNLGEKKLLIRLSIVQFVSGLMDVVGVASIAPFIAIVFNNKIMNENKYLVKIKDYFNFDNSDLIVFIAILSLSLILLNIIIRIFTIWFKSYACVNVWVEIHNRTFKYYISQPYSYHIETNSNLILEKLQIQINSAVAGVITPFFSIIGFIFTCIFLFAMLVVLEPIITFSLLVFLFIFYFLVYSSLKKKIHLLGTFGPKYSAKTFKLIDQAFRSIKDIKIKQNENFYINLYNPLAKKYADNMVSLDLYSNFPRFSLELFAYSFAFILIIYLQKGYDTFSENIAIVGLYALALQKILPAVQGIFQQIAQYKFYKPTLDIVYKDIEQSSILKDTSEIEKKLDINFENKIQFKNIKFKYPSSEKNNLEIDYFEIKKHDFIGITGKSGSGKSTFIDLLTGLMRPSSGEIKIDDNFINEGWKKKISYVPQNVFLADDSILNNIALGISSENIDFKKVKKTCEIVQLSDFIESDLPNKYETVVGENGIRLSGGQRQRIGIARALYNSREVLVLDEATNSLDVKTEELIIESISKSRENKTVIMVTHRVQSLKKCDKILILENGLLLNKGSFNELINTNLTFKK
jgi:ABC-type multidrug transport system fused ATPase/permease subunit